MQDNQDELASLLCGAIQRFYQKDADSLWRAKVINERAMVGCVYRYMWEKTCHLAHNAIKDIDIEYDRMCDDAFLETQKAILAVSVNQCRNQKECSKKGECTEKLANRIELKTDDNARLLFRPDLIFHNRGKPCIQNNALIVEFKKEKDKDVELEDVYIDQAKLLFLTCPQAARLQYKLGALVMLRKEYADVGVYRGGKVLVGYKVDESGFRKMTEVEYGGKPWLNQKKAMQ